MTESELRSMEEKFDWTLPEKYREWALQLPSPGEESESWQHAFNDADHLIKENYRLRTFGLSGLPWLSRLICVGEFEGNHFFIDMRDPVDIFYSQHDGEPTYGPDDYSSCRVQLLKEFCKEHSCAPAEIDSQPSSKDIGYCQNIEKLMEDLARENLEMAFLLFGAACDEAKASAAIALARVAGGKVPAEVEEFLNALPGEVATADAWIALVKSWGRLNPVQSIACAQRHLKAASLIEALRFVLDEWCLLDNDAARRWLVMLTDPILRNALQADR